MVSGAVWPGELFDVGQGPEDFDPDGADRWLRVVGEGSRAAFGDMERFIASVEPEAFRVRLRHAISGKTPFKAFLAALQRDDDHFTIWHRHRDGPNGPDQPISVSAPVAPGFCVSTQTGSALLDRSHRAPTTAKPPPNCRRSAPALRRLCERFRDRSRHRLRKPPAAQICRSAQSLGAVGQRLALQPGTM